MSIPVVKVIYNRRNIVSSVKPATVEIEIKLGSDRIRVSTGVKVVGSHWKHGEVVNQSDASELNNKIMTLYNAYQARLQRMVAEGCVDLSELRQVKREQLRKEGSFLDYLQKKFDTRMDLREGTRKHHKTMITAFKNWGGIVTFKDITLKNIKLWDEHLQSVCPSQTAVYNYHKALRPYVKMAFEDELIKENPYIKMHIDKGEKDTIRYLTEEERNKIEALPLHGPVGKARDMFIFGCYTGLAYCDLIKVSKEDIFTLDGNDYIIDKRTKTGNEYKIMLLPKAKEILEKYKYNINLMTNQKCNEYLQIIAQMAEISTHVTMHVARHTFATWGITKGLPIETVSKMLAHSDIQTTQLYAKVLDSKVVDGYNLLKKFC